MDRMASVDGMPAVANVRYDEQLRVPMRPRRLRHGVVRVVVMVVVMLGGMLAVVMMMHMGGMPVHVVSVVVMMVVARQQTTQSVQNAVLVMGMMMRVWVVDVWLLGAGQSHFLAGALFDGQYRSCGAAQQSCEDEKLRVAHCGDAQHATND